MQHRAQSMCVLDNVYVHCASSSWCILKFAVSAVGGLAVVAHNNILSTGTDEMALPTAC